MAANGKHKRLVIVESPAKARTIKGYLGDDFVVESSVGHIRDLPERAADIPEEYKKEKWARLGVERRPTSSGRSTSSTRTRRSGSAS